MSERDRGSGNPLTQADMEELSQQARASLKRRTEKGVGLFDKYLVIRTDGKPMDAWCFVLVPANDPAARVALEAYAEAARKDGRYRLAADLEITLFDIEEASDPNV